MSRKRKQPPYQSEASKIFCFVIMLACLISFLWLALYSQAYYEAKPREMTLGELVEKANKEAEAFHAKKRKKLSPEQARAEFWKNSERELLVQLYPDSAR